MHDCQCAGNGVHQARHLDVRPMLASGTEPFSAIMEAVDALEPGQALVLRTPFDPAPLHRVLAGRGFGRESRQIGDDDWETTYVPGAGPDAAGPGSAGEAGAAADPAGGEHAVTLDVRGLMPPEPLERTLAALEDMEPGERLLQVNERVPVFLLPVLEERGYQYAVEETRGAVRLTIWRETPR